MAYNDLLSKGPSLSIPAAMTAAVDDSTYMDQGERSSIEEYKTHIHCRLIDNCDL